LLVACCVDCDLCLLAYCSPVSSIDHQPTSASLNGKHCHRH